MGQLRTPMNYQGPGIYQHYKGGMYLVLGLALQENTVTKPGVQIGEGHEEITHVVYKPLSPGSLLEEREGVGFWARELSDFNGWIDGGDEPDVPRFHKVAS